MKLVVDGFGKSISKRDNQIVIKQNGKELDFFLASEIEQILITGKGSITFDALTLLAREDVECASINWKGEINYKLMAPVKKNASIQKEQYLSLSDNRSGFLAKEFIKAKILNQKGILSTLSKSREDEIFKKQINHLNYSLKKLEDLPSDNCDNLRDKIFGIEGISTAHYWKGFKKGISNDDFIFKKRSGKGAGDPVNALLNYGYGFLKNELWKKLSAVGLDPYCGFLHSTKKGGLSLVFDLMEEFRQQFVDKTVLSFINRGQVKIDDFTENTNYIQINDTPRKLFVNNLLTTLSKKIYRDKRKIELSDIMLNQAKQITKFLMQKEDYQGFYLRW